MYKYSILLSYILMASTQALTIADFEYVTGKSSDNYSRDGRPLDTYNIRSELPSDTLVNVYSMLPEGTAVSPEFIAEGKATNIAIDGELGDKSFAEVAVTFLNEGAGYRNSLGYFIYDTNNPPKDSDDISAHVIIFPNASKPKDGSMVEGDTLDLGIKVYPGESIGFFIIPNGWGWSGYFNNIASLGNWGTPFYTLTSLNPEIKAVNRRHNVVFLDAQNDFLIVGFEDLYRPNGDNDFNDLLFSVHVTPFSAVDGVNEDGSTNSNYEILTQKNAKDITVTNIYPSANSWATLAYEDRWPAKGDYDFNDLVMQYRITETLDGQRNLLAIDGKFNVRAMGGDYHNGFAIRLPNVSNDEIYEISLLQNNEEVDFEILERSGNDTIIILSEDVKDDLEKNGFIDKQCKFFRTQESCIPLQTGEIIYEFRIEFTLPISKQDIGSAPYDPFIFATPGYYHGDETGFQPGRKWETHLKKFGGTDKIDESFFSIADDASTLFQHFVSENNFPWALNLSYPWNHPMETIEISHAYTLFPDWVDSNGENSGDWFLLINSESEKIAK